MIEILKKNPYLYPLILYKITGKKFKLEDNIFIFKLCHKNGFVIKTNIKNIRRLKDITESIDMVNEKIPCIPKKNFEGFKILKKITFPKKYLTRLNTDLFLNCKMLTIINLPEHYYGEILPEGIFSGLISLKKIKLPKDIRHLPKRCFYKCLSLEKIDLSSILIIEESAFHYCEKLRDIKFSVNLKKIGSSAFNGCLSIRNLELPHKLKKIEDGAFRECITLKRILISSGLEFLGFGVFYKCSSLEKVLSHNLISVSYFNCLGNISEIPNFSFFFCTKLKTFFISNNIERVKEGAFFGCTSLENVLGRDGLIFENRVFSHCTNLKNIPKNSNENLNKNDFYNCKRLKLE